MNKLLTEAYIEVLTMPKWVKQLCLFIALFVVAGMVLANQDNPFAPPSEWKTNASSGARAWWDFIAELASWISLGVAVILLLARKTEYLWIPLVIVLVASLGDDVARWAMKAGGVNLTE